MISETSTLLICSGANNSCTKQTLYFSANHEASILYTQPVVLATKSIPLSLILSHVTKINSHESNILFAFFCLLQKLASVTVLPSPYLTLLRACLTNLTTAYALSVDVNALFCSSESAIFYSSWENIFLEVRLHALELQSCYCIFVM